MKPAICGPSFPTFIVSILYNGFGLTKVQYFYPDLS
jgi:hypothetical protein